jgi:tryptophan synthase alpha chain
MAVDRIASAFQAGHPAFIPYAVAGYPDCATSQQVFEHLAGCGADLLEVGVPFSDPLADGPVIQTATQRALANGVTLADCIATVAVLRARKVQTPALLMGYVNPIIAYGLEQFVADSAAAGVDGFIVPDLPPEEAGDLEAACQKHDLALVHLLAPTSPPERIALVAERARGFVYLVSVTGITGARATLPADLAAFVARVRAATSLPLAVGFGIQTGEQARAVGRLADGVVVGSALVECAGRSLAEMDALAREIRAALA